LKAVFVWGGDCGTRPDSFAGCICRILKRIDAINRTFIRPENVRIFTWACDRVDIRQFQATVNKPTVIGTTTKLEVLHKRRLLGSSLSLVKVSLHMHVEFLYCFRDRYAQADLRSNEKHWIYVRQFINAFVYTIFIWTVIFIFFL